MKKILLPIAMISILLIDGCSSTSELNKTAFNDLPLLKQKIEERFSDSLFTHAHWGALIKSLKTGDIWYERNSEKMFMPASNEKIPTSASALVTLGPDFSFETYLSYDGEIIDSNLNGNIVVFGNGDPTLYNRFFNDPRDVFRSWVEKIKSLGIKQIDGNIIGDDNAFEDYPYGYGWTYDDLDAWYSAEIGSLQLNEDNIDLKIIPPITKDGAVVIEPNLPSSYFKIENNTLVGDTGRTNLSISRAFGTNNILVSGYVKAGSREIQRTPSITNPTLFYVTVLKEVLEENGIRVNGNPKDCDDILDWKTTKHDLKTIDLHNSPPLKNILAGLLKRSQNLYAETFTRVLGWKKSGIGSFKEGKKVVENVLAGFGIKPGTYAYMDGSGLSRYNYISPKQLVQILEGMKKNAYWQVWYDAFPIAGIDGTLRNRMKGTKTEGNVHAKTGTISNVRGLSGYITTADGEPLVFSFLVNGHLRSDADTEYITDSVLEIISQFNRN
ncbi:MAG: D-alanyl-D-alanine carboxypeptidase/D-alanyl-D-alanine-endopeptidase [Ignavibacteriales bacterium]|nr:D-alanyl-D-alanine carboxypeptidase/D-alanyl-D-alanine-endopeptidase [Ignavibacteriales bacterium]